MARKNSHGGADRRIAALARRQHDVIDLAQLRGAGLSDDAIRTRVARATLHRLHRGVYAVGSGGVTRRGRWLAAVRACGPGAALSHLTAAVLWDLLQRRRVAVEVCIPSRVARSRPGIVVHRRLSLPAETTHRGGIPVTTPLATILDVACRVSRRDMEKVVDAAYRTKLCAPAELEAGLVANPGRAGARPLRAVLAEHRAGSTLTRSELEERFLSLCADQGLPRPMTNVAILDYTVDFFWPGPNLMVEVDGYQSHGTPAAFQHDRDRDGRLRLAVGMPPLRFTWADVVLRPAVVANRIRNALRQPAPEAMVELPGL